MSTSDLYQEIVLEHSRAPRYFGPLATHTHAARGVNPLCGDTLQVALLVNDGRIAQIGFDGETCAITRATASLVGELVVGLTAAQVVVAAEEFARVVAGESNSRELGDLNALGALVRYPTRRKCALLPFATLRAALAGAVSASTES